MSVGTLGGVLSAARWARFASALFGSEVGALGDALLVDVLSGTLLGGEVSALGGALLGPLGGAVFGKEVGVLGSASLGSELGALGDASFGGEASHISVVMAYFSAVKCVRMRSTFRDSTGKGTCVDRSAWAIAMETWPNATYVAALQFGACLCGRVRFQLYACLASPACFARRSASAEI